MSAGRLSWRSLRSLCLLPVLLAAAPAGAACELGHAEIPVRILDRRPIATLTLNGTDVPMLVDSGAFFSFVSEATAKLLNLALRRLPPDITLEGYTGRIDARMTRVDKVGLLGTTLSNVEFIVGGNELGAGIMGVLGRNFLAMADTEYDLAHGVVRLVFPKGECKETNMAYWAGEAPVVEVPLESEPGSNDSSILVSVKVNGKPARALLDTGATRTSMSLKAARSAGVRDADLTEVARVGGFGEGGARSWRGQVDQFELGGEKISKVQLRFDDVVRRDYDMLIGLDYFLSHRIYVSRLQRKVYVTWNGGSPFAFDRRPDAELDTRYAALPADVPKDDAGALMRRAAASVTTGKAQSALDDLDQACVLAPGVAECFFIRARAHLALRQFEPALADLDKTLQLDPGLVEARSRRVAVLLGRGRRQDALSDMSHMDATLPPAAHQRLAMGSWYASLEQVPEALRQFDLWIEHHPKDATRTEALNSRCWLRARKNLELPLALRDCQRAVELDPGNPNSWDSLGWTQLRLGDATKARDAFDRAIKLKVHAVSLFGRGLAKRQLNDPAGSEQDLADARRLDAAIDANVVKQGFDFAAEVARPASWSP